MPNWCRNMLYVTARHDENDEEALQLNAFREKLLAGVDEAPESPRLHLLDTFVPMPAKYEGTVEGSDRIAADDGLTWWDWQRFNWGVKWGDCQGEVLADDQVVMTLVFDTPWGPPTEGIQRISSDYPRLHFYLDWEEESGSRGYIVIEAARIVGNFSQEDRS